MPAGGAKTTATPATPATSAASAASATSGMSRRAQRTIAGLGVLVVVTVLVAGVMARRHGVAPAERHYVIYTSFDTTAATATIPPSLEAEIGPIVVRQLVAAAVIARRGEVAVVIGEVPNEPEPDHRRWVVLVDRQNIEIVGSNLLADGSLSGATSSGRAILQMVDTAAASVRVFTRSGQRLSDLVTDPATGHRFVAEISPADDPLFGVQVLDAAGNVIAVIGAPSEAP